jgi:hypothetical protein
MTEFGSPEPADRFAAGMPAAVQAGYCTNCGSPYGAGQLYCGRCGHRLAGDTEADAAAGAASTARPGAGSDNTEPPQPPPTWPVPDGDPPYGSAATVGAVLLAIFMPVIALIAGLALRSQEQRPRRRQFLKNWAIGSAAWLCTGWLIPIIAFSPATSGMSGCHGGIDQFVLPSYQSNDGVHWEATYACVNGGTETKPVPRSQVPGG